MGCSQGPCFWHRPRAVLKAAAFALSLGQQIQETLGEQIGLHERLWSNTDQRPLSRHVINVPNVTNITNITNITYVTNIAIVPILLRGGARTNEVIATLEPKGISKGIEDWGF
jgi:hypothetical protein